MFRKYLACFLTCAFTLNLAQFTTFSNASYDFSKENYIVSSFDGSNFHRINEFKDGLAAVYTDNTNFLITGGTPVYSGFIDTLGNLTIPQNYFMVGDFSDGVAVASKYVGSSLKYGVIDHDNIVIVDFIYDYISPFYDGYAYAGLSINGSLTNFNYGYLNTSGEFVTPIIYQYANISSENFAAVSLDSRDSTNYSNYFIDMSNKTVIKESTNLYNFFSEGLCAFALDSNISGPYGYIDTDGEVFIEPIYNLAANFVDGYAIARDYDNLYHILKTDGSTAFTLDHNIVFTICNGYFLAYDIASSDTGFYYDYFFYDTNGNQILNPKFTQVKNFNDGLALVGSDTSGNGVADKFGYIDITGQLIIPLILDSATNFSENLATVSIDDTYYVISNPLHAEQPSKTAVKTTSPIFINGTQVEFDAFKIDNNNFFKLRDLAYILSDKKSGFNVLWNEDTQTIDIFSNQAYTPIGGEMSTNDLTETLADSSYVNINFDGQPISLVAYNINFNNYFKLRDIFRLLDMSVTWDSFTDSINIHTTIPYTE